MDVKKMKEDWKAFEFEGDRQVFSATIVPKLFALLDECEEVLAFYDGQKAFNLLQKLRGEGGAG